MLLGNGDGTFLPRVDYLLSQINAASVAVADFNADLNPDLAVAVHGGVGVGVISVLLGNGDGTFASPRDFLNAGHPLSVAVADLNGDGQADLATRVGALLLVLPGNGDGTFQTPTDFVDYVVGPTFGAGPNTVAIADLNQDGRPDVAVTNSFVDELSVLLNIATFPEFVLTVNVAGGGSGSVTSSPPGIDCGSTCSASFVSGLGIALTATPVSGSRFGGWSGAGCSGTGVCQITLTSNQTVTATFDLAPDFSVTLLPPTPNPISRGQSSTATVTVNAVGGFSSAVAFSCSVQPSPSLAPRCSVSPNSVTPPANGPVTAVLTITTTAPTLALAPALAGHSGFYAFWFSLPTALWLGIGWSAARVTKRKTLGMLSGCLLCAGLLLLAACGGGSPVASRASPSAGTPPGVYTITVTGTSGAVAHSAVLTLNVQ